ncbi:hypothetical protein SEA_SCOOBYDOOBYDOO_28 [Mycobacterium phage ScoobyDoobyDoo]|nr:hypothetical protein SEA_SCOOBYDOOBYDOO_28 [Mycobacterium phage ScoobyDoobyDoo]
MSNTAYKLTWKTTINSTATTGQKKAETHFGTIYTVTKDGTSSNWTATVTVPKSRHLAVSGGTEELVRGVSFARAKAACVEDATRNGGR